MPTPLETIEKKVEEGIEWARVGINSKVGEVRAAERRGAYYDEDVQGDAEELVRDLDSFYARYRELIAITPYIADPAEERRRRQLPLPGTEPTAASPVADPAEERRRAVEEGGVEEELGVECDRVGVTDLRASVIRRPDGVLCIAVSGERPEAWAIEREAPRVLGALRQLADGAGDEQVRAILCQVAGAQEPRPEAAESETDAPTPADVLAELQRLDFELEAFRVVETADDEFFQVDWRLHGAWAVNVSRLLVELRALEDVSSDELLALFARLEAEADERNNDSGVFVADRLERAIGAELTRLGADGIEASCECQGADGPRVTLTSSEDWMATLSAADALERLRAMPDDAGEGAVRGLFAGAQAEGEGPDEGTGVGPKGAVYVDDQGREVGVYEGIAPGGYGAMWRSKSGGLHRIKSSRLPMRAHWSFAQADLDEYAVDRGWRPVDEPGADKASDVRDTTVEPGAFGKGPDNGQPEASADLPRKPPAKKRKSRAEADGDDVVVGGEK